MDENVCVWIKLGDGRADGFATSVAEPPVVDDCDFHKFMFLSVISGCCSVWLGVSGVFVVFLRCFG